ncbi:tRNA pseudouridine(38-40) synthase TruA [Curvivirga sp.]|uniref:tRNA pseudouridine(38-40) synthase TruA n=1 Tax=Curvivirga sp. TaxID=2856848 RepID=UPI003B5C7950
MKRWKITIEYDGGPYVGWQRQNNGPSIQQSLEEAINAFSQEEIYVQGAGRTDAGVHATGQVAHFDMIKEMTDLKIREAINAQLRNNSISVLEVEEVDMEWHARFSAVGRAYLYRILDRRARPALDKGRVWHCRTRLDHEAMHGAAQRLIGQHDFSSFRASECQAESPIKTLDKLDVSRHGDEIHIIVEAKSFLHHQVRNFAGTLQLVGSGRWTADDITKALEAKDRQAGGPTAPSDGLYLTTVIYPD